MDGGKEGATEGGTDGRREGGDESGKFVANKLDLRPSFFVVAVAVVQSEAVLSLSSLSPLLPRKRRERQEGRSNLNRRTFSPTRGKERESRIGGR